ncbi:MAG: hypothetical protein V4641_26670 [Pseudomonadota bacterium]
MTAFRCVLTLWMESRSTVDGVAVARGKVTRFTRSGGHYGFRFLQTDTLPGLIDGCREFDVEVLGTGKRRDAAAMLMNSHSEGREVELAYLGSGLLQVGHCCLFLSPGRDPRQSPQSR